MHKFYYKDEGGRPAFQVDSFFDVHSGKIPAAKYAGKIVLIGATALGIGQPQATPVAAAMPPVLSIGRTSTTWRSTSSASGSSTRPRRSSSTWRASIRTSATSSSASRAPGRCRRRVMLGGARSTTAGGTILLEGGGGEKPMLGRYQVEKELGKGATGIVYLGRDLKINRVVAIKTMALSQEFEEAELADVKERFFREAETAGRLNHPNIVTMYDAGEEHDLAYIAMEFLKGKDLVPWTKPASLLPLHTVTSIVARVADALDYAHRNNVVHRDIKPGNIMYEPEADQVKVTDFGIARITDASKTKTAGSCRSQGRAWPSSCTASPTKNRSRSAR